MSENVKDALLNTRGFCACSKCQACQTTRRLYLRWVHATSKQDPLNFLPW